VKKWIEEMIFLKPLKKELFSGLEKFQNLSINLFFGKINGILEIATIKDPNHGIFCNEYFGLNPLGTANIVYDNISEVAQFVVRASTSFCKSFELHQASFLQHLPRLC
jgi:hypothetical protein